MPEQKLCPFRSRLGDKSAFAPCYGTACMAYCEYSGYKPDSEKPITEWETVTNPGCKLMHNAPAFQYTDCALSTDHFRR